MSESSTEAAAPEQHYVTPDDLLLMSYKLGRAVLESGFNPDFIVGIWRGGAPVGIAVQEYLAWHGNKADHISIRTSSYKGIGVQGSRGVKVHGLQYIVDAANAHNRLLLVDDIFDTGRSMEAVVGALRAKMRLNCPQEIRIAVPFWKPHKNRTALKPDYHVETTDKWIVFPHELEGMSRADILRLKGPAVAALF